MRILLAIAAIVALVAGASAQFINRATWLGEDEEGIRRNFEQGNEYFIDRLSYVIVPPWWDRGLQRFGNEVQYRFGSINARDFTVEGHVDHQIELGDGVSFRYHLLQGEHRDARFVRNEIALEYALNDTSALFAQGELLADKSRIDISGGVWLMRSEDTALRVMFTAVDQPNGKSEVVEYEQDPYGVMVAGAFGDRNSHRVVFELGAQLPFELQQLDSGDQFEMERYIGTVETHLRLSDRDWLVGAIESERTDKELRPIDPLSPLRENFERDFHQLRVEWWRDDPAPWSIGFVHVLHDEHGRRPNDPTTGLENTRREWYAIARAHWPVSDKLSFEPQLLAGNARIRERDEEGPRKRNRFEGKIAWNARWDFSPNMTLALIVSTQLDEPAFGGGGAQFVARF